MHAINIPELINNKNACLAITRVYNTSLVISPTVMQGIMVDLMLKLVVFANVQLQLIEIFLPCFHYHL